MQAQNVLADDYQPREVIFAARDRCDETVEHLRCVRTQRFKYIRNFLPNRPHLQPNAYKDKKSILISLREAHAAGTLNEIQEQIFAPMRPEEELYDLEADPHEIHNLADNPDHQQTLLKLRNQLEQWMIDTDDQGRRPESAAMYDSDMDVYRAGRGNGKDAREQLEQLETNIQLMKQWAREGK
jgi:arylsulfatase A-like enzyme